MATAFCPLEKMVEKMGQRCQVPCFVTSLCWPVGHIFPGLFVCFFFLEHVWNQPAWDAIISLTIIGINLCNSRTLSLSL